jgi:hypothetical protein
VAYLLDSKVNIPRSSELHTTASWYYRACRAAIAGGAGQLSGPFRALQPDEQAQAIPQLNVLNIEAAAAARLISARVLLSPPAARGVLAEVLEEEHISCDIIEPG